MSKQKLYVSEAWLTREYLAKGKSAEQIALEQGASKVTIYKYLQKFGLKK